MSRVIAVAALWLALPLGAQTTVDRFYGYAFDLKTDAYLYTEVHEQVIEDGRWVRGSIAYYRPDGSRIGFKPLDFSADPFVPVFELSLDDTGYREGITDNGDPIVVMRREKAGAAVETRRIAREGLTCADSGFHNVLVANFDRLMQRERVQLRLVVAGSLDQFKFRARRIDDGTFEGRTTARFLVEPDSLLRFVVDPLELSYDPDTRRLLEYRGLSNIPDPKTGKPYVTRIAYYSEPPAQAGRLPPLQPPDAAEPTAADEARAAR
ncbi:hypothetical protein [Sinimarinibacterium thermocellulolyticum]|uniref:DUF3108 domain-containing protein n=1 Tax=Sinimarinibacterium thermocellulolyticum TaxID=3170016 RepID=A0ABV2A5S5_9GAMM